MRAALNAGTVILAARKEESVDINGFVCDTKHIYAHYAHAVHTKKNKLLLTVIKKVIVGRITLQNKSSRKLRAIKTVLCTQDNKILAKILTNAHCVQKKIPIVHFE